MPITKKIKFIKDTKGNVLLYNMQNNTLLYSFAPSQNIVKSSINENLFQICSFADTSGKGVVLDYRLIDNDLCFPVIVATNINEFLLELSKKFFFLAPTNNTNTATENIDGGIIY